MLADCLELARFEGFASGGEARFKVHAFLLPTGEVFGPHPAVDGSGLFGEAQAFDAAANLFDELIGADGVSMQGGEEFGEQVTAFWLGTESGIRRCDFLHARQVAQAFWSFWSSPDFPRVPPI